MLSGVRLKAHVILRRKPLAAAVSISLYTAGVSAAIQDLSCPGMEQHSVHDYAGPAWTQGRRRASGTQRQCSARARLCARLPVSVILLNPFIHDNLI